jgi:aminoglycoside phosphotransferase (APT) family kinase protein
MRIPSRRLFGSSDAGFRSITTGDWQPAHLLRNRHQGVIVLRDMPENRFDHELIGDFIRSRHPHIEGEPEVLFSLLQGGLESAVARIEVRDRHDSCGDPIRFVVKKLSGDQRQEARAYELLSGTDLVIAPRLLGVRESRGACYLFLAWIPQTSEWPWNDLAWAGRIAEQLAKLHEIETLRLDTGTWDYELDLSSSARKTLELVEAVSDRDFRCITQRRASLRRFVAELPAIRDFLFNEGPLNPTLIHGDAHPGNAIVHDDGVSSDAFLIDWGRTRLGSPFEDLSSWLQSLGVWEQRARQGHDRLLRRYLHARGLDAITPRVRDHYWIAAGCNSLSGALRFHLLVAFDQPEGSGAREYHVGIANRWMAVVRRAEERWRRRNASWPSEAAS